MTKVADEKHSLALRQGCQRRTRILSVGNWMGQRLAHKIVNQISFLLGDGQNCVRRGIDVQFTPHLVGIVGSETGGPAIARRATEDASRLAQEMNIDRV